MGRELVASVIVVPALVVLLGDAEVHERAVPDVADAHASILSLEQHRAHPDERRALLRGDPVILRRAHGELGQAVVGRQLAQAAKVRPRRFRIASERRHRREAHDLGRAAGEKRPELLGRDARLRIFPREIHLHDRRNLEPTGGGLRVERVHELARRVDGAGLAALEMSDEVPPEGCAEGLMLR